MNIYLSFIDSFTHRHRIKSFYKTFFIVIVQILKYYNAINYILISINSYLKNKKENTLC